MPKRLASGTRAPHAARVRRLAAAGVLVAALAFAGGSIVGRGPEGTASESNGVSGVIRVVLEGRTVAKIRLAPLIRGDRLDTAATSAAVIRAVRPTVTITRGPARIRHRVNRRATSLRVVGAGPDGGVVKAASRVIRARVRAPVLTQAQRNSCESAALSILLDAIGQPVDQNRLQRELPRSGPLDPREEAGGRVWGDPELGYVGRSDGGGAAGGFGVYQRPVARVAARHGVRLEDLSGSPARAVYARLRQGKPVMVWIGLSDGPYGTWRSPAGRRVRVNFGEHTVVLTGIARDGSVDVSNPLQGTRERWDRARFELMFQRLGRRALAA